MTATGARLDVFHSPLMNLHQQPSSTPKQLAPSARGIRLTDNISLSAAIASSAQNQIATGLYCEATEPTDKFLPRTLWHLHLRPRRYMVGILQLAQLPRSTGLWQSDFVLSWQ